MKLAYFGTPQFSADFLGKMLTDPDLKDIEVTLVVTQPDKPVGRKQVLTPSSVKVVAQRHKIPVIDYLPTPPLTTYYLLLTTLDLALVYAYGKIIPADLLSQPRLGFWNIHPSLLPKYRGASPTAYPLINGDTVTGVTLMQMDEKMDHGPIISQEKYEIKPHDRRPDLERELTQMGFELFKAEISRYARNDTTTSHDQDHDRATYTKLLKKDDGFIPAEEIRSALTENGVAVYNKFRGLYPWPGVWTLRLAPLAQGRPFDTAQGRLQRMKITDCTVEHDKLVIKKVQFEGKNEIPFAPHLLQI